MAPDALQREYAALATDYERRWQHYLEATTGHTLHALAPRSGECILDVACGTGFSLKQLADKPFPLMLVGIDTSTDMLSLARGRLPSTVALVEGNAGHLPFPTGQFDAVITTNALHYVDTPQVAIDEMARVLAPHGRLIITDWCRDFVAMRLFERWLRLRRRPLAHVLHERDLARLVEVAGLNVKAISRFGVRPTWGLMALTAGRQD